jgi:hypothetical protein
MLPLGGGPAPVPTRSLLTSEARRIAANIAKLQELVWWTHDH